MANSLLTEQPFLNSKELEVVLGKRLDHRRLAELEPEIFSTVPEVLSIHGCNSDWCCKDHSIHFHDLST